MLAHCHGLLGHMLYVTAVFYPTMTSQNVKNELPYRYFRFLFQAVLNEQRPRHAADDGRHAALAAGRCVGLAELQRTGCQVDLCAYTRHRVDVEVILLTLQIQPGGSRDRDCEV